MMARENDPKTGMSFQKPNIFGKSQKKSETGVTKLSTAFRAANKFSNSFTPHFLFTGLQKALQITAVRQLL